MNYCRKCRLYVYLSIVSCLIGSFAVFFVVKVSGIARNDENNIPMYIVGAIFWLGLLGTYLFSLLASYNRKKATQLGYGCEYFLEEVQDVNEKNVPKRIGVFSFFKNIEAKVADVMMMCGIVLIVVELCADINHSVIVLFSIFLTIFSLHMHGILNGKNYYYLKVSKNR